MALSPLGVLDLSMITDTLRNMLNAYIPTAPLWASLGLGGPNFAINVTGAMPDSVRKDGACQLSIALIHVVQDKLQRNSVITPFNNTPPPPNPPMPRAQLIPFQPLALDLYYLVTAFASDKYVEEQQAMSLALLFFYQNPIVRKTVVIPGPPPQNVPEEFTLTMEMETSDELARFWQALTVAYRLSVVYRVGVVFMTPPGPSAGAKQVTRASLAVESTSLPYAQTGQVVGTSSSATYATPASTVANPEVVTFDYSPATVIPGQRFLLYGGGLNQKTSNELYVLVPDSTFRTGFKEVDVTASWKLPDPDPTHPPDERMAMQLPASVGALPANAPPAGVYQLRVGNNLPLTNPAAVRSNATPFSVAAPVKVTIVPPNPPVLPAATPYVIQGLGFVSSHTEVLLDTVGLTEVAGPPGPGEFRISAGTSISFQPPTNLGPGLHAVRIRVNQVESPPGWWIKV